MQEVILILDKSGSMQGIKDDAVGGYNSFISDQKNIGDCNITRVWFDDRIHIDYEGSILNIPNLTSWPSGGSTSLNDAIGKAINHVKDRFTKESPEKVILAILTDGHENSSIEFSKEIAAELIKEHQEKYGWTIIFLAADQDAWQTAKQYGILKDHTFDWSSSNAKAGFASYSAAITRARN